MTNRRGQSAIPAVEWAVAALGLVLVLGSIGYIAWEGIAREETPPEIAISALSTQKLRTGYVVAIRARNSGGTTAADVKVEGTLREGSRVVETSEMTFRYLPLRSTREGGLFFENDPARYTLTLRARGYETP